LCWTAAWDMTRDVEVSAGDYLSLVHAGLGQETEIATVLSLTRLARQAIEPYGDPSRVTTRRVQLCDLAFGLLDAAPQGSDLQLGYARCAAVNATTDQQLDRVAALLSGEQTVAGLSVDTELRWALLHRLVVVGRAADAEIDAERERDDTNAGRRHALRLLASRPTAEAKAEAWASVVEQDTLPNADLRAVMAGFQQYEHRELLVPYVEKYFDAVGEIYRTRTSEMAQYLIEELFPHVVANAMTVQRADDYLRDKQPGPALRRMLLEGRDSVARALRGQERDRA
jgi:aminopeptidase N